MRIALRLGSKILLLFSIATFSFSMIGCFPFYPICKAHLPKAPTNVQATDGTVEGKIVVTWNASSLADSYNVYRSEDNGVKYSLIKSEVVGLVYEDSDVKATTPPTYYMYKVTAENCKGESKKSTPDQGYAKISGPIIGVPQNVTASQGTLVAKISVSWDLVTDADHYRVYRSTDGASYSIEKDVTGTSTEVDSAACANVYYKVSAVLADGTEGSQSSAALGFAMCAPSVPGGLGATQDEMNQITVSWTASTGQGTITYNVYGSDTDAGTYTLLTSSPVSNLSFVETGLGNGQTRYYKVSAVNGAGESAQSASIAGKTLYECLDPVPTSPASITATDGQVNHITVTWEASENAVGYRLYKAATIDGSYTQVGSDTSSLTLVDTVATGAVFYYKVSAYNNCGESVMSFAAKGSALGVPPIPTGVGATDGALVNQIDITWSASAGATSYNVYRADTESGGYTMIKSGVTGTNYSDSVATGACYYYKISAVNAAGESGQSLSDGGCAMDVPAIPADVKASDGSFKDKIQVSWTAVTGAISYNVYRADTETGAYSLLGSVSASPYDDTNAPLPEVSGKGQTVYYKVSAVNDAGEGPQSADDAGYTSDCPGALAIPTIGASQGTAIGTVHVSWSAIAGASAYDVYRATSSTGPFAVLRSDVIGTSIDDATSECAHYFYTVAAKNTGCNLTGAQSAAAEGWAMCVPPPVTGVSASMGTSDTTITVTWSSVTAQGAVIYRVYRSTSSTGTYDMVADNLTVLTYSDPAVSAGQHYFYKVAAANEAGAGAQSAAAEGYRIVGVVTGVSASQGTIDNAVEVKWSATAGATSYSIYKSLSATGDFLIADTTADTSYVDDDLLLAGPFWYKVSAVNSDGEGAQSAAVEGWPYNDYTVGTPTGVNASDGTYTDKIAVSWSGVTDANSYKIYRDGTLLAENITLLSYDDTTAVFGATYSYTVSAVNEHGQGAQSTADTGYVGCGSQAVTPAGLAASTDQLSQITITWTAVSVATSYNVYVSDTADGTYTLLSSVTGTSYVQTGLAENATRYYKVSSVNLCGESSLGSYVIGQTACPLLVMPTGLSATTDQADRIDVTWDAVSGATSYNVYINGSSTAVSTVTNSYSSTGLSGGVSMTYVVSAVNACGEGAKSGSVTGSTKAAGMTINMVDTWFKVMEATPKSLYTYGYLVPDTDAAQNGRPAGIEENRTDSLLGKIHVYVHAYYNFKSVDLTVSPQKFHMDRYAVMLDIVQQNADGTASTASVLDQACTKENICLSDVVACDYEFNSATLAGDLNAVKSGDTLIAQMYPLKLSTTTGKPVNPPKMDTTKTCTGVNSSWVNNVINAMVTVVDAETITMTGDPIRSIATLKKVAADDTDLAALKTAYANTTCYDDEGTSIPCKRNKNAVCPNEGCCGINQPDDADVGTVCASTVIYP